MSRPQYEAITERFQQLPLYYLRFFGSTQIEQILDAMEYSVYAYDVEHIILDNLQFLLGATAGYERFDAQERAIHAFRKFATAQNVHVTLVIHPRKEPEDQPLNISSVFGTAKATQEADNVLILQNENGRKKLEVKKNRFDGDLGYTYLSFNHDRLVFEEDKKDGKEKKVEAKVEVKAEAKVGPNAGPKVESTEGIRKSMGKAAHEIIMD